MGVERIERKRAAKAAAVLDAAMTIVVGDGLPGLSMAKVADKLDVAVGGLYRYFPSKEAIIVGLQRRAAERFAARLVTHLAHFEGSPLQGAVAPFWFYLEDAEQDPESHKLFDIFLSTPDPLLTVEDARTVEPAIEAILCRCDAQLQAAAESGAIEPGDPRERTLVAWGSIHGLEHFRHRQRFQPAAYGVKSLARTLLTTLLLGWGANAAATRRVALE